MATMTTTLSPLNPARLPRTAMHEPTRTQAAQLALAELFPDVKAAADEALADLFPALRLHMRRSTAGHEAARR